jgi:hypothetical protein
MSHTLMKMPTLVTSGQIHPSFLRIVLVWKEEHLQFPGRSLAQERQKQSFSKSVIVDVWRYLLIPLALKEPEYGLGGW